ncbi:MAG: glutamate-5-semialdehyde dehydrogenase [Cyanobacteriota bacterium]
MEFDDSNHFPESILQRLKQAHGASQALASIKGTDRSQGVLAMAEALGNAIDDILEANTLDLETSREMAVPEIIIDWLKLTPERLQRTIQILERLAEVSDPIGQVKSARYQLDPSQTYCQLMPLGVIALVYEAFPELGAIAAGLSLKSGNSLILRGSSDASHSNGVIAQVLRSALDEVGLPLGSLETISSEGGSSIQDLVTQDHYLNLVIPYGRPSLIQQVTQLATAPVLRSAMGNCYLFWSSTGDLDLTRSVILDSHITEPDAVNAIEKVVITRNQKPSALLRLFNSLKEKGFQLRGDAQLVEDFPEQLTLANPAEWGNPYLDQVVAFKVVETLEDAIAWINQYSSGHADCLVTESYQESRQFALEIDSALVYINASPRFYRNPHKGESVFLGMSNQKGYRRGLIGLQTFTTLKQVVQGEGRL